MNDFMEQRKVKPEGIQKKMPVKEANSPSRTLDKFRKC